MVSKVAAQSGYDLVIQKGSTLYAKNNLDITQQILDASKKGLILFALKKPVMANECLDCRAPYGARNDEKLLTGLKQKNYRVRYAVSTFITRNCPFNQCRAEGRPELFD